MSQTIKIIDKKSEYFDLVTYPDGQHSICLHLKKLDVKKDVRIIIRAKNWSDLEVLACVVSALRRNDFGYISVHFAYLFGLRSDRAFRQGEPNYTRDVLAPFIKALNVRERNALCPHSELSVFHANICTYWPEFFLKPFKEYKFMLGGDQSFCVEDYFYEDEHIIVNFEKKRGEEVNTIGIKLSDEHQKTLVDWCNENPDKPLLIVDDLCDAGGTFIAEAMYLRDVIKIKNPLHLFVFHGIFSKGLAVFHDHFEKVITTNSYQDFDVFESIGITRLKIIDIWNKEQGDEI